MLTIVETQKTVEDGKLIDFPGKSITVDLVSSVTIAFRRESSNLAEQFKPFSLSHYKAVLEWIYRSTMREAVQEGLDVPPPIEITENLADYALIIKGDVSEILDFLGKAGFVHTKTVNQIKIDFLLVHLTKTLEQLPETQRADLRAEIEKTFQQTEKKFINSAIIS